MPTFATSGGCVATNAGPVPLTILTGFLGAGKTTLLTRILREPHGLRIAVLVNDFGPINIDAELITEVSDDVISLSNGCICCSIRGDLVDAVERAINSPQRPDYIVLEASGVAEPAGILATFADEQLRDRIRLDTLACVVDASTFLADRDLTEFKATQAAFADLLVLNKTDLVPESGMSAIRQWISTRFHRCRVVECQQADVPLAILLSAGTLDPRRVSQSSRMQTRCACSTAPCLHSGVLSGTHRQRFASWALETDARFLLESVRSVASRLPTGIYRAKGLLRLDDGRRAVLHVVGKRVDLTVGPATEGATGGSRIVAIGAHHAWSQDALYQHFMACAIEEGVTCVA